MPMQLIVRLQRRDRNERVLMDEWMRPRSRSNKWRIPYHDHPSGICLPKLKPMPARRTRRPPTLSARFSPSRFDEVRCKHLARGLEAEFNTLANKWESETRNISSPRVIVSHPIVQEILVLGEQVVPMILRRMEDRPWFWFELLMKLTKSPLDPITPDMRGDMQRMTEAWLKWGAESGII
jgi:hypothetical protein